MPTTTGSCRRASKTGGIGRIDRAYLWIVLCVTVLIEPVQLLVNIIANAPANAIDIDDFLMNAAGCLLGLAAAELLLLITRRKKAVEP